MTEIKLGDKVRCKITGFTGIATAKTEFINGCVQFLITPKWDKKKAELPEDASIDSQSLEIIKSKKVKEEEEEENGGPSRKGFRMRGY